MLLPVYSLKAGTVSTLTAACWARRSVLTGGIAVWTFDIHHVMTVQDRASL